MPLVTTVTRFKAKTGCVDELVDASKCLKNIRHAIKPHTEKLPHITTMLI